MIFEDCKNRTDIYFFLKKNLAKDIFRTHLLFVDAVMGLKMVRTVCQTGVANKTSFFMRQNALWLMLIQTQVLSQLCSVMRIRIISV